MCAPKRIHPIPSVVLQLLDNHQHEDAVAYGNGIPRFNAEQIVDAEINAILRRNETDEEEQFTPTEQIIWRTFPQWRPGQQPVEPSERLAQDVTNWISRLDFEYQNGIEREHRSLFTCHQDLWNLMICLPEKIDLDSWIGRLVAQVSNWPETVSPSEIVMWTVSLAVCEGDETWPVNHYFANGREPLQENKNFLGTPLRGYAIWLPSDINGVRRSAYYHDEIRDLLERCERLVAVVRQAIFDEVHATLLADQLDAWDRGLSTSSYGNLHRAVEMILGMEWSDGDLRVLHGDGELPINRACTLTQRIVELRRST